MAELCDRDPGAGRGGTQCCSSLSCGRALLPASPAPRLDLGKKVSTPQDLMIEELSLRNNRGSQLFQQRQKRMQRFVFEHPSGYREVGLWLIPQLRAGQPFPGSRSLCREAIPCGAGGVTVGQLCSAAHYAEMKGGQRWLGGLSMEVGKHQVQHPLKSKGASPPLHPLTLLLTSHSSQGQVAHTAPRKVTQRER